MEKSELDAARRRVSISEAHMVRQEQVVADCRRSAEDDRLAVAILEVYRTILARNRKRVAELLSGAGEPAPLNDLRPWCISIGASGSDGLQDLKRLLAGLPPDLPAVVMVVLHRPEDRPSVLCEVLRLVSRMPVRIPDDAQALEEGVIYVGHPDQHLTLLAGSVVDLIKGAPREYRNRTVDLLFFSLARHAGPRAIGVVLSGSLDDGARGLAAIHEARGVTMVLTPERGKTPGMPENAIDFDGPINVIGSPEFIAAELIRITMRRDEGPTARESS